MADGIDAKPGDGEVVNNCDRIVYGSFGGDEGFRHVSDNDGAHFSARRIRQAMRMQVSSSQFGEVPPAASRAVGKRWVGSRGPTLALDQAATLSNSFFCLELDPVAARGVNWERSGEGICAMENPPIRLSESSASRLGNIPTLRRAQPEIQLSRVPRVGTAQMGEREGRMRSVVADRVVIYILGEGGGS